jgi:hypothetical protein
MCVLFLIFFFSLPDRLADVEAFIRDNPAHPLRVATPNRSFEPNLLRRLV